MKKLIKYLVFIGILLLLLILLVMHINSENLVLNDIQSTVYESSEVYQATKTNSIPEFYGTTAINLRVGDKLDLSSSVFRIFAKDFYDGDLTQEIETVENNVNTSKAGNYYIKYQVSNSSGNTAEIEVPVIVKADQERTIERKLYPNPDSWNTELNGVYKGNGHDRQNLGIYTEAGANIKIRGISGNINQIKGDLFNDNRDHEKTFTVTNDWTTITPQYDSVPFIKTLPIKEKETYQNSNIADSTGYYNMSSMLESVNNTISFGNLFKNRRSTEYISSIKIPINMCYKLDIYLFTGEFSESCEPNGTFSYLGTLENPKGSYAELKLDTPLEIEAETFGIFVDYTGERIPMDWLSDATNFTYLKKKDNTWKILEGGGNRNIPPIICETTHNNTSIIEINIEDIFEEDSLIKPLDYYTYGDDETKFFEQWDKSQNSFAVLENDRITFLVPIKDRNSIVRDDGNSYRFKSIKDVFNYYNDVFKMYDNFLGLEEVTTDIIHQNVKTKFFAKADIGYKSATAYMFYSTNYTAQRSDSMSGYFRKEWGPLHEIAHGYDGDIDNNDIELYHVQNNIFSYYMQKTYLRDGDYGWLGSISENETNWNNLRKTLSKEYNFNQLKGLSGELDLRAKLYMMVNMFNKIGAENSMGNLYRASREDHYYNAGETKEADLITKSFSEASSYNVVPYLESWYIEISEEVKREIETQDYPMLYYLRDLVADDSQAQTIKSDLGLEGIYSLVSNDEIKKYNIEGAVKIQLSQEDFEKLQGYNIILKSGANVVQTAEITSTDIVMPNVPIGVYEIELSTPCYTLDTTYVIVKQDEITSLLSTAIPDTIAPELSTLKVTTPNSGIYKSGQSIEIVATFNEAIQGTIPTLNLMFGGNIAIGVVNEGEIINNTIKWNYTIMIGDNGELTGSITGGEITDLAGNVWIATIPTLGGYTITADTIPPTVTITADKESPTNADTITYTVIFEQPISGFNEACIRIENGKILEWSGSGTTYTIVVENTGECEQRVGIKSNICKDEAGNSNLAQFLLMKIDKTAPVFYGISVTTPETGEYQTGEEIKIEAGFSEVIYGTVPTLNLMFGEEGKILEVADGLVNGGTITYTYIIKCSDIGELSLVSYDITSLRDEAGNYLEQVEDINLVGSKITAAGHNFGEWIIDKEPTYKEEGLKYRVCTECKLEREEEILPKVAELIFSDDLTVIQKEANKYVRVMPTITVNGLKEKIYPEALLDQIPEFENILEEGKLKTGSIISLNEKQEYTIVVNGDINCDGLLTFRDIIIINSVRIEKNADYIPKEILYAGDFNITEKIELEDIISINNIRINSSN